MAGQRRAFASCFISVLRSRPRAAVRGRTGLTGGSWRPSGYGWTGSRKTSEPPDNVLRLDSSPDQPQTLLASLGSNKKLSCRIWTHAAGIGPARPSGSAHDIAPARRVSYYWVTRPTATSADFRRKDIVIVGPDLAKRSRQYRKRLSGFAPAPRPWFKTQIPAAPCTDRIRLSCRSSAPSSSSGAAASSA